DLRQGHRPFPDRGDSRLDRPRFNAVKRRTVMKTKLILLSIFAVLAPQLARADVAVIKNDDAALNLGGMTQAMGLGQTLSDPYRNDARMFLFLKTARVRANGNYQDFAFNAEATLGGEEAVVGTTGVSLSLLDLSVNLPLRFWNKSYVK